MECTKCLEYRTTLKRETNKQLKYAKQQIEHLQRMYDEAKLALALRDDQVKRLNTRVVKAEKEALNLRNQWEKWRDWLNARPNVKALTTAVLNQLRAGASLDEVTTAWINVREFPLDAIQYDSKLEEYFESVTKNNY